MVEMKTTKAYFAADGSNIKFSIPFSKVDEEKRIVSGFATLDNVDKTDDVLTAEASRKAFATFQGNIREQHDERKAVGRMINFTQQQYYDPATEKVYDGIYVSTYISKGAPDTWEKILDGTLTGFSVGGGINKARSYYDPDLQRTVREVEDYSLTELSVVDNPANQLSNIFSIQKSDDGIILYKGMATQIKSENVFFCDSEDHGPLTRKSIEEAEKCDVCGGDMVNIGWIETNGDHDAEAGDIAALVKLYLEKEAPSVQTNDINEGGIDMEKNEETVEKSADVVEEVEDVVEETADEATEVADEDLEKAAEVSEVEDTTPDFEKMLDDLKAYFTEALAKSDETANESLAVMKGAVEDIEKTVAEIKESHDNLTKTVAGFSEKFEKVERDLQTLDKSFAVKKSDDLGGSSEEEKLEKVSSIWHGSFLSVKDL
jgi:hypothetical protein